MEEDDVVWADGKGDVNIQTYAYCVPCLPSQVKVWTCANSAGGK